MTLHFAYGSNMSRALMAMRCPGASALGTASLAGWRFVVNPDGVGSIEPRPGRSCAACSGGWACAIWPRSMLTRASIPAFTFGAYCRSDCGERLRPALVYIARRRGEGTPRPGYISVVVEAAREWGLPESYIRSLQRWSPSGWRGARTKDTGEFG